MDRAERAAWLALVEGSGHGPAGCRALLVQHGSPEAALAAGPAAWRARLGPPRGRAADPAQQQATAAAVEAWLAGGPRRRLMALGEPDYPALLLETPDPPLLLYAEGRTELLAAPALAIVGTRHPSPTGEEHAHAFAAALARAGLLVVSGLARGIDAAAHLGALAAGGGTVALIGTGIDQVYPRAHAALSRRIAAEGLLLSEYPLGAPPLAGHFPRRNRLIAGLARGTLVVEAALASGSLITARLAAEAGREVFALPGSLHNPQARGCHALIKQGAQLVETVEEILAALRWGSAALPAGAAGAGAAVSDRPAEAEGGGPDGRSRARATPRRGEAPPDPGDDVAAAPPALPPAEPVPDPLLAALGHEPVGLDALCQRSGLPAAVLAARLLDLELAGQVRRLPGQRFLRLFSA